MTNFKMSISLLFISIIIFTSCNSNNSKIESVSQKELSVAEKIARVYGIELFNSIDSINFTFNVQKGEKQVHRKWHWEPKDRIVKFFPSGDGKPITYSQTQLLKNPSDELKNIDAKFINDQYWLLFPLHLVLDKNVKTTLDKGSFELPIGEGKARRVIVEYTGGTGYTPNDKYELYIDDDFKILQWIYRKNNSPSPTRLTKWEDYKNIGPLYLSLNRPGKDESFRVWFTDVEVK